MSLPQLAFNPELRAVLQRRLADMDRRSEPTEGLKEAAVTLVILPGDEDRDHGEASIILTRRAMHLSRHSGQFALPGGRIDAGETPVEAALRELHEEVGLLLGQDRVLGLLDDYVTCSGYHMTSVVVWGDPTATIRPNPDEVAAVHRVPLTEIAAPDTRQMIDMDPGRPPAFSLAIAGTLVFAPTAAIMHQLGRLAVDGEVERVQSVEEPRFAWK